jgi:hypothetical protein
MNGARVKGKGVFCCCLLGTNFFQEEASQTDTRNTTTETGTRSVRQSRNSLCINVGPKGRMRMSHTDTARYSKGEPARGPATNPIRPSRTMWITGNG